ncbi:peptidoglycan editing factor PgeF [Thiomicrorhabdus xiamenensis]|uniref:Purine nucleoside phosphorylase n=1 Tax=Thiomicrorhabdus xiamenensis TaxID=2739063 RepID=A0A7D4T227_9GAMM|nr:peptidoglycan editing factor PgeF [Thiomicrorhabdus xiamenensis]
MTLIEPDWPAPDNVRALSTTRAGGVSATPYDSLNLALHVGDDAQKVLVNREKLVADLGLRSEPLWLNQQHTTKLVYFDEVPPEKGEVPPVADACWSDRQQRACVVMTADCMPILLCDRAGTWVAAIHAGWKGLLDGIVESSLQQVLKQKKTPPNQVLAWIGPSISQANFEVGSEVHEAFVGKHAFAADYFQAEAGKEGKYLADLGGIVQRILQVYGVEQVTQSGLCTYAEPERFYSYRYACHYPASENDFGRTGRIASLIWLAD